MFIKKIGAEIIKDSRKEPTIKVIVKTDNGSFETSAPSGKSKGKYEVKSYDRSLKEDIKIINEIKIDEVNTLEIEEFRDLDIIEKLISKKIGGNSLFALEASLLKALAKENKKELWEWIASSLFKNNETGKFARDDETDKNAKDIKAGRFAAKFPRPVGNAIGGGLHSKGRNGKKPDFQEFLFIANGKNFRERVDINYKAYRLAGKLLSYWFKKRNDEGAFETDLTNEGVLNIMKRVQNIMRNKNYHVDIGIDVAASSFYKNSEYNYKNPKMKLKKGEQVTYISNLIKKYNLFYIEDAFEENDFPGFRELNVFENKNKCLIVGDDLTATNPERLEKAIRLKSINAVIVKPNQIGSLLKVKEIIEIAKKNNIKTIISHRSGETMDDTIADLAVGFSCDFIKSGIYGKEREIKLKRLIEIERKVKE